MNLDLNALADAIKEIANMSPQEVAFKKVEIQLDHIMRRVTKSMLIHFIDNSDLTTAITLLKDDELGCGVPGCDCNKYVNPVLNALFSGLDMSGKMSDVFERIGMKLGKVIVSIKEFELERIKKEYSKGD